MFDKQTEDALSTLSDEDLFKVSKMIQKLASKSPKNKPRKDGVLHKISSNKSEGQTRIEPINIVENRVNLFDEMSEKNEHKSDVEIDKMLSVLPPSERYRNSNLVRATCRSCDKTEEVSASLVPQEIERYICNRCQVRGFKK